MIIKDNRGNDYEIPDLEEFKNHILTYHTINDEADYSLHEENGRYFTVTPSFLKKLLNS
tara:strand:- start:11 stop:187 length:177 start_codon:yes stop_codon:yes gene_type:complete